LRPLLWGAALGGVAGFLALTEPGRRVWEEFEPRRGAFSDELARLQVVRLRPRQA